MSVLDDISTQDGLSIRVISSGLSCHNAEFYMSMFGRHEQHRMDAITYSQPLSDVPANVKKLVNHWWRDGKEMSWGLPGGSFKEFNDRLKGYDADWADGSWKPDLGRETTEARAKDMLLASYLYPLRWKAGREDLSHKYISVPILCNVPPSKLYMGSKAVYDLLNMCEGIGADSVALRSVVDKASVITRNDWWDQFNRWMISYSVGTSPNENDFQQAQLKGGTMDEGMLESGMKYLALGELANIAESAMRSSRRNGRIGKGITELVGQINTLSRSKHKRDQAYVTHLETCAWDQLCEGSNARDINMLYDLRTVKGLQVTATKDIAWVRFKSSGKVFCLNTEDIKSLKFVAMSHSTWWVYASSMLCEDISPESDKEAARIDDVKKVAKAVQKIQQNIMKPRMSVQQEVVSFDLVKPKLMALWKLYTDIRKLAVGLSKQDYVGRYVHSLFEVYTSVLGGHLAEDGLAEQEGDVAADFSPHGFHVKGDLKRFKEICSGLPMSALQDFGRVSKIVPSYDVNPMYSFLDRASKMQKPNEKGHVEFTDAYEYTIRDFTDEEEILRKSRFFGAGAILATVADLKTTSMRLITAEDKENLDRAQWVDVVQYLRRNKLAVRGNVTTLQEPWMHVPEGKIDLARKQADELVTNGTQPTEPLAGLYLNIDNVDSYMERGDPDIAMLKASSCPAASISVVFSSVSGLRRSGPVRNTHNKLKGIGGDMITDFLGGKYPSRDAALQYCATEIPIAKTSDKVETNKYPLKTRVITSLSASPRRVQSEYEHNNGKVFSAVPGFTVGADPAAIKKAMYAAIRDSLPSGMARLFVSLDLSSWSTGMSWDIQEWTNILMAKMYDGGVDMFAVLNSCTKGSAMVASGHDIRLYHRNTIGANYEGVDGKRNTFMHCILWYLARCEMADKGVEGPMRSLIFIDDGAANIEVPDRDLKQTALIMRQAMFANYKRYGFKLSIRKTVVSEVYVQFLNEVYFHGMHIGYGFRALCHTGAQSFPDVATVAEELSVITGGVRGAAYSGGHPLRLLVGMNFILYMYFRGIIGSKGHVFKGRSASSVATCLFCPTNMGGFGLPNALQLFSNLSGNAEAEKYYRPSLMFKVLKHYRADFAPQLRHYMKEHMMKAGIVERDVAPDRLTVSHPSTAEIGAKDRSMKIARAALKVAKGDEARELLSNYIDSIDSRGKDSIRQAAVDAISGHVVPSALAEKGLASDPDLTVSDLVEKIASSRMIHKLLPFKEIRSFNRRYVTAARRRLNEFAAMVVE